jgi:hypothetical protein
MDDFSICIVLFIEYFINFFGIIRKKSKADSNKQPYTPHNIPEESRSNHSVYTAKVCFIFPTILTRL